MLCAAVSVKAVRFVSDRMKGNVMTAKGTVKMCDGGFAVVEVRRRVMCDGCPKDSSADPSCGHSCAVGVLLGDRKNMAVRVKNTLGANPGDTVELETKDKTVLMSAFTVFILPLALAFVFYFASRAIFNSAGISALCALAGIAVSCAMCAIAERRAEKDGSRVVLSAVLAPAGEPSDR